MMGAGCMDFSRSWTSAEQLGFRAGTETGTRGRSIGQGRVWRSGRARFIGSIWFPDAIGAPFCLTSEELHSGSSLWQVPEIRIELQNG